MTGLIGCLGGQSGPVVDEPIVRVISRIESRGEKNCGDYELSLEDRGTIIAGVARYGNTFLEKYPRYLVIDKHGRVIVRLLVHMMSVYNVDTVGQRFECKLYIQMRWRVKTGGNYGLHREDLLKTNIDYIGLGLWIPRIDFVNNVGKLKIDDMKVRGLPCCDDNGIVELVSSYTVQSQFFEKFEVNYFPFDAQKLQIYGVFGNCPVSVVVSEAEQATVVAGVSGPNADPTGALDEELDRVPTLRTSRITPSGANVLLNTGRMLLGLVDFTGSVGGAFMGALNSSATSSGVGSDAGIRALMNEIMMPASLHLVKESLDIYDENFVQSDSWKLGDMELRQGRTLYDRDEDGVAYSTVRIVLNIERRFGFYFWNIVFPVFILVNLSFMSFLMGESDLIDRLTVTLTLILTMFALKFAVSQYLPPTNYLTYLDRYVVISYVMLCVVAVQNVICSVIDRLISSSEENAGVSDGFWSVAEIFNVVSGVILLSGWWMFNGGIVAVLWNKKWRQAIRRGDAGADILYQKEIECS